MGLSHSPKIVTDGLVLCVDAASRRSYPGTGTTWTDLAGGNNGTLTNGPTFSSDNGGSIEFDGTNDSVQGGDTSGQITNACSICVWYKTTGVPSNNDSAGAVLFCQSDEREHGVFLTNSWDLERCLFGTSINDYVYSADDSISNNSVHYLVGLQTGSKQQIYIDGILSIERAYTLAPYVVSPAYQIGRWGYSSYGRYLNGHIYHVGLYNKALTADEVIQNYNATRGRFA